MKNYRARGMRGFPPPLQKTAPVGGAQEGQEVDIVADDAWRRHSPSPRDYVPPQPDRLKPFQLRSRLTGEGVVQDLAMSREGAGRADFDALIGPHLDAGYRTALAILRNPDEAHDAVQESAFKAWRKLSQRLAGK